MGLLDPEIHYTRSLFQHPAHPTGSFFCDLATLSLMGIVFVPTNAMQYSLKVKAKVFPFIPYCSGNPSICL